MLCDDDSDSDASLLRDCDESRDQIIIVINEPTSPSRMMSCTSCENEDSYSSSDIDEVLEEMDEESIADNSRVSRLESVNLDDSGYNAIMCQDFNIDLVDDLPYVMKENECEGEVKENGSDIDLPVTAVTKLDQNVAHATELHKSDQTLTEAGHQPKLLRTKSSYESDTDNEEHDASTNSQDQQVEFEVLDKYFAIPVKVFTEEEAAEELPGEVSDEQNFEQRVKSDSDTDADDSDKDDSVLGNTENIYAVTLQESLATENGFTIDRWVEGVTEDAISEAPEFTEKNETTEDEKEVTCEILREEDEEDMDKETLPITSNVTLVETELPILQNIDESNVKLLETENKQDVGIEITGITVKNINSDEKEEKSEAPTICFQVAEKETSNLEIPRDVLQEESIGEYFYSNLQQVPTEETSSGENSDDEVGLMASQENKECGEAARQKRSHNEFALELQPHQGSEGEPSIKTTSLEDPSKGNPLPSAKAKTTASGKNVKKVHFPAEGNVTILHYTPEEDEEEEEGGKETEEEKNGNGEGEEQMSKDGVLLLEGIQNVLSEEEFVRFCFLASALSVIIYFITLLFT